MKMCRSFPEKDKRRRKNRPEVVVLDGLVSRVFPDSDRVLVDRRVSRREKGDQQVEQQDVGDDHVARVENVRNNGFCRTTRQRRIAHEVAGRNAVFGLVLELVRGSFAEEELAVDPVVRPEEDVLQKL